MTEKQNELTADEGAQAGSEGPWLHWAGLTGLHSGEGRSHRMILETGGERQVMCIGQGWRAGRASGVAPDRPIPCQSVDKAGGGHLVVSCSVETRLTSRTTGPGREGSVTRTDPKGALL